MASREQMEALLAVLCPWCGAGPREMCSASSGGRKVIGGQRRRRVELSTLDGGCHDARWRKALDAGAPVLAGAVEERRGRELVSSAERPW